MNTHSDLVKHRVEDNVLIVEIEAPFIRDTEVAQALRDKLIAVAEQTKPENVIIDCAPVQYIGSVGLLGFMSLRRQIPEARIIFTSLNNLTQTMFLTSRLVPRRPGDEAAFEEAETIDEAKRKLAE